MALYTGGVALYIGGVAYIVILEELQTLFVSAVPPNRAKVDQAIPELDKRAPVFKMKKKVFKSAMFLPPPQPHLFFGMSISAM